MTWSPTATTEAQAHELRDSIADRLRALGLELHPEKTKVVYCKDANRPGEVGAHQFRLPRLYLPGPPGRGRRRVLCELRLRPSVTRRRRRRARRSGAWHLNRRMGTDLSGLAAGHQPPGARLDRLLRGLLPLRVVLLDARRIDEHLVRWAMHKFKRFRHKPGQAYQALAVVKQTRPRRGAAPRSGRPGLHRIGAQSTVGDRSDVRPPWAGVAYVCFITDAYSRMIVGWRVAGHMRAAMVLDAIEMARWSRGKTLTGLRCHSDAGSQFTSIRCGERLAEIDAVPSIEHRRRLPVDRLIWSRVVGCVAGIALRHTVTCWVLAFEGTIGLRLSL